MKFFITIGKWLLKRCLYVICDYLLTAFTHLNLESCCECVCVCVCVSAVQASSVCNVCCRW